MNLDTWQPITDCLMQWERQANSTTQSFAALLSELEEISEDTTRHANELRRREIELNRREEQLNQTLQKMEQMSNSTGGDSSATAVQLKQEMQQWMSSLKELSVGESNEGGLDETVRKENTQLASELAYAKGRAGQLQKTIQLQNEVLKQHSTLAEEVTMLRKLVENQCNLLARSWQPDDEDETAEDLDWKKEEPTPTKPSRSGRKGS